MPKASSSTQVTAMAAKTRRGAVSNQSIKILPPRRASCLAFDEHTGPARCHHQRLALAKAQVLVLLRGNLRLDDGVLAVVPAGFGVVGGNKFQPGDRPDHDGAAQ